jgi:hypothetical protein
MRWRLGVWISLILGWLLMLLHLWAAFASFPSAERLEQTRMTAIPTLQSLAWLVGRSGLELLAVLAALWPWRAGFWTARVFAAALLLVIWFIATTPLTLSAMVWVHRRWIAAMALALLLCGVVAVAVRVSRLLLRAR